jgi:hypothetical protein
VKISLLALTALYCAGCASLPRLDSAELMKRLTDAHSQCQSYEESGTIRDVEVEGGQTNLSHVHFNVQFVRDLVFRLELHCERKHGVGPYSLVYYWDRGKWSEFNSINTYYQWNPVKLNADEDFLIGGGVALSFDLMPFIPRILCLSDHLCGFRGSDGGEFSINGIAETKRADVTVECLHLRSVYCLRLKSDVAMYRDEEDYWIDPNTYTILKRRSIYTKDRGDHTDVTTRESSHHPKLDTIPKNKLIEFNPPASPANKGAELDH